MSLSRNLYIHLGQSTQLPFFTSTTVTAMSFRRASQAAVPLLSKTRPSKPSLPSLHSHSSKSSRCLHHAVRLPAISASNSHSRPTLQPLHQPSSPSSPLLLLRPSAAAGGSRTIFIQTENTPNADALKFLPNHPILPAGLATPFLEYTSPRATLAAPHPSPLAAALMNVDGVSAVFYGADFITVTKAPDANWAHIKPEVFSLITEAVTSGAAIVNVVDKKEGEQGQGGAQEEDTLSYNENDSEVVGMIKELLETRIRPAIQEDGGDIEFRGFEDGNVLLKLRGACRTCDSSTVTLKNGIEGMLMHYVSILSPSEHSILLLCLLFWGIFILPSSPPPFASPLFRCILLIIPSLPYINTINHYLTLTNSPRSKKSRASSRSWTRRRRSRCRSSPSSRRSSGSRKAPARRRRPGARARWTRCPANEGLGWEGLKGGGRRNRLRRGKAERNRLRRWKNRDVFCEPREQGIYAPTPMRMGIATTAGHGMGEG